MPPPCSPASSACCLDRGNGGAAAAARRLLAAFPARRRCDLLRRAGRGDLFPAAAARRRARHGGEALVGVGRASGRDRRAPCCSSSPSGPRWPCSRICSTAARSGCSRRSARRSCCPALIELRACCSTDARPVCGGGLTRLARLDRRGARPRLQRRPPAAFHHRICLGRDRAQSAVSRSTMTARRCRIDAAWERAEFPQTTRRRWATSAPAGPVPAPTATMHRPARGRRAAARFDPARGQRRGADRPGRPRVGAAAAPPAATASSSASAASPERYYLRCAGRACDGATLDLLIGSAAPVEFTIVGTRERPSRRSGRRSSPRVRQMRGRNMARTRPSRSAGCASSCQFPPKCLVRQRGRSLSG